MADTKFLGKHLILSVWDPTGVTPAYKPIACLTSSSMSETIDFLESSTKCDDGNRSVLPNNYSATHSFEGEVIDTIGAGMSTAKQSYDTLKLRFRLKEKLTWKLHTVTWNADASLATDDSFILEYGKGYISDLEVTGEVEGYLTFSGTLQVDGIPTATNPQP